MAATRKLDMGQQCELLVENGQLTTIPRLLPDSSEPPASSRLDGTAAATVTAGRAGANGAAA